MRGHSLNSILRCLLSHVLLHTLNEKISRLRHWIRILNIFYLTIDLVQTQFSQEWVVSVQKGGSKKSKLTLFMYIYFQLCIPLTAWSCWWWWIHIESVWRISRCWIKSSGTEISLYVICWINWCIFMFWLKCKKLLYIPNGSVRKLIPVHVYFHVSCNNIFLGKQKCL